MLLITSSAASYCLLVLGVLKQIAALTVSVSPRLQWTRGSSSQCCCIWRSYILMPKWKSKTRCLSHFSDLALHKTSFFFNHLHELVSVEHVFCWVYFLKCLLAGMHIWLTKCPALLQLYVCDWNTAHSVPLEVIDRWESVTASLWWREITLLNAALPPTLHQTHWTLNIHQITLFF